MAFYNSPRVSVFEIDATLGVAEKGDAKAGLAGVAMWGPVNQPTYMTGGEQEFARRFGKPTNETYLDFFVAADYTSYVSKLVFTRVVGDAARNAVTDNMEPVLVRNESELETANLYGYDFIGRYPGSAANGVVVSIADKNTFPTWEFRNTFQYEPQDGEFSVAVVDGGGYWTGNGALQQVERISFSGTVVAGVQQKQTVTFVGSATGGTAQEETLTVSGGTTAGAAFNLTVDGNDVPLTGGMTEDQVATAIADALAANAIKYKSASAVGNRVYVVFAVPQTQSAIAPATSRGTSVSSTVTKIGNPRFILSVYGKDLVLNYGDNSQVAAKAYHDALKRDDRRYKDVTQPVTNSVQYTFVVNGAQTTVPSELKSGFTVTTVVDTAGDNQGSLTIFDTTVPVLNGDTALVVAGKTKTALQGSAYVTANYDLVSTEKTTVQLRRKTAGAYALGNLVGSNQQLGLYVDYDIRTPGRRGEVIEKYELMKQAVGSRAADGTTQYFYDAINNGSNVIAVADKSFVLAAGDYVLSGGVDDNSGVNRISGIRTLQSSDSLELEYVLTSEPVVAEQKIALDIAEERKDVVTFVAPPLSAVLGNAGNQVADILEWKTVNLNRDTSYGVAVDNWGYIYDSYNDTYRWIPCTGGTAGLYARTARDNDPWISPAGFERGRYKNYQKTAWSSSQNDRDELYKYGVNSIVTFLNEGVVLYGDKTMTTRPSAFSRTNVRFAFIAAEKGIADLAKRFLFEVNDEFTRAQFLNAVRPFLRNMTNRRAFEDFKVVCDESNNGPSVRAENRAVAHIFLKPLYSINFIDLYFVATRPDVSFEEVEGQLIS